MFVIFLFAYIPCCKALVLYLFSIVAVVAVLDLVVLDKQRI
jgi:hypothetical protein